MIRTFFISPSTRKLFLWYLIWFFHLFICAANGRRNKSQENIWSRVRKVSQDIHLLPLYLNEKNVKFIIFCFHVACKCCNACILKLKRKHLRSLNSSSHKHVKLFPEAFKLCLKCWKFRRFRYLFFLDAWKSLFEICGKFNENEALTCF